MNKAHTTITSRRTGPVLLARSALMFAVALAVPSAGLGFAGRAGAVPGQSLVYGFTATSSATETFAEVPTELTQGSPSGTVFLEKPNAAFCEGIAGVYDLGIVIDDFFEITIPNYKNPTRTRVTNPESSVPTEQEFSTFPGGPYALADCETPESGVSRARWGGEGNEQGSIHSAFAETKATRTPGKAEVVTEGIARLTGVQLGAARLSLIESYLKVVWAPEAEPVISYRLSLGGLFNGDGAVAGFGEPGLTIAGQAVGGTEFVQQFNEQSEAHEQDFEALGKYGFRILQPRYFEDDIQGRPTIQMACVEGSLGFAARKGGIGDNQGIRFGLTRAGGVISERF